MTPENKQIIFLAGYSAAGKSTLAREMSVNHGYQLIEHQPFIHQLAVERGFKRARNWLEHVGIDRFAEDSSTAMVSRTADLVSQGGKKIVLDATYGLQMLNLFDIHFPDLYRIVVSVIASNQARLRNIQRRMGGISLHEAQTELDFRDDFLKRVGITDVLRNSHFSVKNEGSIQNVALETERLIVEFINNNSN